MDLVRDVLDQPIADGHGRPMGRVDGIVLEVREDGPPRVVSLAVGAIALGERLHPAIGRWLELGAARFPIAALRPLELGIGDVVLAGATVRLRKSS